MKVGIYARVSTTTQDLENQLSELREFSIRKGWEVYAEYTDFGVSGADQERDGLKRALEDARKKRYDLLLFWALDRLSRSGTRDTLNILNQLDDWDVQYKSYQEEYIDSMGIFKDIVISIISTLGKLELKRISKRICAGLKMAKKKGIKLGRPRIKKGVRLKIKNLRERGFSYRKIKDELDNEVSISSISRIIREDT